MNYFKLLIQFLLLIGIIQSCQLSEQVDPQPETNLLLNEELAIDGGTLEAALQNVLNKAIAPYDQMGISAAIIAPGQGKWNGVAGVSYEDVAITDDMVWDAAGVTKTFVSALLFQLQEKGRLSLNDPLGKFIGPFEHIEPSITLRQLLGNTAGIFTYNDHPDYVPELIANPGKIWSSEEIITLFVNDPVFEPGSDWDNSNTNYILLGMVIEKVTGNSISEEFRRRYFDPLKLESTTYAHEEPFKGELVHRWSDPFGTGTYVDFSALGFPMLEVNSILRTSSGVMSTPQDLAKWALALYGGNVLRNSSLREMYTFNPQSEGVFPEIKTHHGLGVYKHYFRNGIALGHRGTFTHRSLTVFFPKYNIAIAVSVNRDFFNVFEVVDQLMDVVNHPTRNKSKLANY